MLVSLLTGSALCLAACGSSSPTAPATPPPPTPVPCTHSTLFQSGGSLPAHSADFESFTTTTSGRVDVTLDWTFPSSLMAVWVAQGACNFDQFKAGTCNYLLQQASPPKPLKGSIANVPAGTYVLIIGNASDVSESVAVSVVLSSSTCPAASSVTSHSNGDLIPEILRKFPVLGH